MPALVFLVLGKPSKGIDWILLTCRVDPAHLLLELGPQCSTWARSMWCRHLPRLLSDPNSLT